MTRSGLPDELDVVVVGAGSAGCAAAGVLAGRHGLTVAVVEAGPRRDVPAGIDTFAEQAREGFLTDTTVAITPTRSEAYRTGAGVGGGSAVNAMLAEPGDADDFDRWVADHGCAGWSWDEVAPVFERLPVRPAAVALDDVGAVGSALLRADRSARPLELAMRDGHRISSDSAYLGTAATRGAPAVLPGHRAHRVEITEASGGPRATGVLLSDGRKIRARAVVVSTGPLATPRLLADSGVRHERLGRGLMDHPSVMFAVSAPDSGSRLPVAAGLRVAASSGRPLGQLLAFERIDASGVWAGLSVSLLDVVSEGRAFLDGPLSAELDLLGHGADAAGLAALVRHALQIIEDPAMASLGEFLCDDSGTPAARLSSVDDDGLIEWLRGNARPLAHVAGGCAMGTTGPLDARCAVKGVEGLWVADASVMPRIVRANPNLTVTMIGDKVADHVAEALR